MRVGVRVRTESTSSIVSRGCWGREGMESPMGRLELEDIAWDCGRLREGVVVGGVRWVEIVRVDWRY